MEIDPRDLKNILRHVFLFGLNAGLCLERAQNISKEEFEKVHEEEFEQRDADLQELIDEYVTDGYMTYNDDLGSHVCESSCEGK